MLGDLVLATGLSFDVLVTMTQSQLKALQKASLRRWGMLAAINGSKMSLAGQAPSSDDATRAIATRDFERRIDLMKKATGKKTLDLWEVIR